MRVDISDAPEHVARRRQPRSGFYTATYVVIGSIATLGALLLLSQSLSIGPEYKQPLSSTGKDAGVISANGMSPRHDLDSARLQASPDILRPDNTVRQTVFNDQNFIPRGADNVVTLGVGEYIPPRKAPSKGANVTIVGQSPSMKDRACWPYRQGSIESRNCRASIGLKYRD